MDNDSSKTTQFHKGIARRKEEQLTVFCFLIGLGRTPAVPALALAIAFSGPMPLPLTYPFVVSVCGGGGAGGAAASPVERTPVCGATPFTTPFIPTTLPSSLSLFFPLCCTWSLDIGVCIGWGWEAADAAGPEGIGGGCACWCCCCDGVDAWDRGPPCCACNFASLLSSFCWLVDQREWWRYGRRVQITLVSSHVTQGRADVPFFSGLPGPGPILRQECWYSTEVMKLRFVIGKEKRAYPFQALQADCECLFQCSKIEMRYSRPLLWGFEYCLR